MPGVSGKSRKEEQEGVGPRFKRGVDDLDQLRGIEKQKQRSRKARKKKDDDDGDPAETYPLIESDGKSRKRVKNRLTRIKDFGDALNEFGS
jgi:hypothetical protein